MPGVASCHLVPFMHFGAGVRDLIGWAKNDVAHRRSHENGNLCGDIIKVSSRIKKWPKIFPKAWRGLHLA